MTIRSKEPAPVEEVTTTFRFGAPPETVWQCLMFYEDVPHRPWPVLRLFLPRPVRSDGDKLQVGGVVRCTYERGYLIKRTTSVVPARQLRFEVVEQRLGIEGYARLCQGAYDLRTLASGTELALTTCYRGRLRPRMLWRPFERYFCHHVHNHILLGMRDRLMAHHQAPAMAISGDEDPKRTAAVASR